MKTAKKLFSLLLVAVLLMSAIPFQASAVDSAPAKTNEYYINFYVGDQLTSVKGTVSENSVTVNPPANPTAAAGKKFEGWSVNGQVRSSWTFTTAEINIKADETDTVIKYALRADAVFSDVHQHTYGNRTPVAADCENGGYTIETCSDPNCPDPKKGERKVDETSKLGHDFGEWAVVTAAQVGVAGLEKRECERDGCNHYETKAIPALEAPKHTVTFYSAESGETFTREWEQYKLITELPAPKDVRNKRFDGWYTQTAGGERIQVGNTWSGQYNTYYARFIDSVKDNVSNVSVFVRFYSEGIQQGETIFLDSFELTDNDKLLPALQARQADFANKIYNIKSSNDYLWNESFYLYESGEKITNSDMRIDGDTSILLKVDAKKSAKANVLLYVHNKAGEAAVRLYEMNGYTAGNTVTSAAVQNFLKAQTGKTYTISGLYDQDGWEQLSNGQKPTAAGGLVVPTSGTLKIHVILSNYSSSTSSKPASNPSTGDPIMATAGIMVLAAAALVSILELRKRKMI